MTELIPSFSFYYPFIYSSFFGGIVDADFDDGSGIDTPGEGVFILFNLTEGFFCRAVIFQFQYIDEVGCAQ